MSAFKIHDESFKSILGSSPKLQLILENTKYPFAHEAGVFIPSDNTLFVTSNQYTDPSNPTSKKIQICKVVLSCDGTVKCEEIFPDSVPMGNGGVNYKNGVLFCAQGDMETPSGLAYMETSPPYTSTFLLTSFHGRPFNSTNDVVVHSDGSIWFTDPIYGSEQGIRPPATLPGQVYRWDVENGGGIRAVADGFGRCNGICFSPDEKTLYVTDSDWIHGDGTTDLTRASSIYAFDVTHYSGQPFLTNRRLFAFADKGVPDGIKCDTNGNVYSGCGDGVNIWTPGGVLLGRILIDGGAANLCFGRNGELFILNEHKLWRAQFGDSVKGDLLKI
ncbi:hypothetical protein HYALB_00003506 [Hymenoscyphus albidus]|uniref:SMP-30/Gluconolactonase/LRE-like region domain-containing protein n=1 Tax=Hymenoscyphus albidus TaxID=595503 RepID=A0A9N9LK49_9HELO|nr:hypothetical protein HYALB_00003506 [Hymenoscyphus albidus]